MTSRPLGERRTVDLGGHRPDGEPSRPSLVLLVPLGATEQHGPHLPLDTDTRIATAWATRLADRRDGLVVAPALPYGSSGEHQSFGGTLSIGADALTLVLVELIRSAAHHFAAVVLVNGHGGNAGPVADVVRRMTAEGHRVAGLAPRWDPTTVEALDAHAGRTETSLLLHLAPDLVDLDRAEVGEVAPLAQLMDRLRADGVGAVSANGVLGDPRGASVEEGAHLLEGLVTAALPTIDRLLDDIADAGRDGAGPASSS